jgi:adenosine deaminase CECR1
MGDKSAMTDEEWAEAEGVPSLSEPFIQKYLTGRDALIHEEKKQRSGWFNQSR